MANPAHDHINEHLTHLDDLRKQYVAQREALVSDLDERIADIDAELEAWQEIVNAVAVDAKPAAKKAAAKK